jgi:DMSO reductase family type II enzyme molybdopterin subunit
MAFRVTRRSFVLGASSGAALLLLGNLRRVEAVPGAATPARGPLRYGDWRDLYRESWRWDRRVRCTHLVNCWYQRNCAWDVYVKDGVVLREEQAGDYPAVSPDVPDFNPRGCQKGACYSALMYAPDRLRHPLRRVGPRGSGRWKRVGWDEALAEAADAVLDAIEHGGPESVVLDPGGSSASATMQIGIHRLIELLDGVELDTNNELDDGQGGAAVTLGSPAASRSADDYFRSDLILVWGANPHYTQIPNAHFLLEARYRGARLVTIAPDYSASAIHADLFVPVRPGTDAALALAVAQLLLERGQVDTDFIRAQTDLPFLVRDDTSRFLRERDLVEGGASDRFFAWDEAAGAVAPAPTTTLDWGPVRPALAGRYRVETRTGPVAVRPVLERLREELDRDYTPARAARICGVSEGLIRRLADLVAGAQRMSGVAGACFSKFYHGHLLMRAQILLFMLGGHIGRPGDGFDTLPFLLLDGTGRVGGTQLEGLAARVRQLPAYLRKRFEGETEERILADAIRDYWWSSNRTSSVLYWRRHGGLDERSDADWDRRLPRPVKAYLEESFARGWQRKPPETPPRVLLLAGSNLLRRLRSSDLLLEKLWPRLERIVALELRMSSTARHCDLLLPAAGSYEKDDVTNWFTLLSPYLHITQAAVAPVGESKPDWEICVGLARWIERRAAERGMRHFRDRSGALRSLGDFHGRFTFDGRFAEGSQSDLAREVVEKTSLVDASFDELRETGFTRVRRIGHHPINVGSATDVPSDAPVVNHAWRRERPGPWPTLTRRVQFYIDHPFFLELGEELPVHKEPPAAGGSHPLILSGGHTRWSIHAGWRHLDLLLRLQRGEAAAFVASADARARGIADGDRVRIWNDAGQFRVRAKVSAGVRPGTVILYHAWEDHQFAGGRGHRNVLPSPLNPVELAGGYVHLRPVPAALQPSQSGRETRVEMARVSA